MRNDQYAFFKKEDIAVGPAIMLTAALSFVLLTSERSRQLVQLTKDLARAQFGGGDLGTAEAMRAQIAGLSEQIANSVWTILFLVLSLWGTTFMIKRWGWASESEMKVLNGIAVPLVLGVVVLIFVTVQASQ
jgi:hypothetical protein